MRAALVVLVLALAGCGSTRVVTSTTTVEHAATTTTTARPSVPCTAINHAIDTFNQASSNPLRASLAATGVAASLTAAAGRTVGTPASPVLTHASDAWVGLSRAIATGQQAGTDAAEVAVRQADRPLKSYCP